MVCPANTSTSELEHMFASYEERMEEPPYVIRNTKMVFRSCKVFFSRGNYVDFIQIVFRVISVGKSSFSQLIKRIVLMVGHTPQLALRPYTTGRVVPPPPPPSQWPPS